MDEIIRQYRRQLRAITRFRPDIIVVHMGHNDMVRHHRKNPTPSLSTTVAQRTIAFCTQVQANHPHSQIYISATFPRTYTRRSSLTCPEVNSYNKKMKRQGQRLITLASLSNFNCLINNTMWKKISASIENDALYLPDGLHLNSEGQTAIIKEWLADINYVEN